jgi:hypothetical protein
MKPVMKKASVLLIAVLVLAGWLVRRGQSQPKLIFESKPREALGELKVSSSQKAQLAITASGMISM